MQTTQEYIRMFKAPTRTSKTEVTPVDIRSLKAIAVGVFYCLFGKKEGKYLYLLTYIYSGKIEKPRQRLFWGRKRAEPIGRKAFTEGPLILGNLEK